MVRRSVSRSSHGRKSKQSKIPTYESLVSKASNPNWTAGEIIQLAHNKVPEYYEFLMKDSRLSVKQKANAAIDFANAITDRSIPQQPQEISSDQFFNALNYLKSAQNHAQSDSALGARISKARNRVYFKLKIEMLNLLNTLNHKLECRRNISDLTPVLVYQKLNLKFFEDFGYLDRSKLIPTKSILCELLVELYGFSGKSIFDSSNINRNKEFLNKLEQNFPKFARFNFNRKFLELSPYAFLRVLMLHVIDPKKNHLAQLPQIYRMLDTEISRYLNWRELQNSLRKELIDKSEVEIRLLEEKRRRDREVRPPRLQNKIPSGSHEQLPVGWETSSWWTGGE